MLWFTGSLCALLVNRVDAVPSGAGAACGQRVARCMIVGMSENERAGSASASAGRGVGSGDLHQLRRELFIGALEVARADHDPGREWESFAEVAWREAALAFGFVERDEWPGSPEEGR